MKKVASSFVSKGRILRGNENANAVPLDQAADVEANLDRTTELAVALAERLIGAALEMTPENIALLAAAALSEAKGARKARIEANPIDVASLREHTVSLGDSISIEPNADLPRGALVLHTDLGTIDARLTPQLERLARALRDALR